MERIFIQKQSMSLTNKVRCSYHLYKVRKLLDKHLRTSDNNKIIREVEKYRVRVSNSLYGLKDHNSTNKSELCRLLLELTYIKMLVAQKLI